VNDDNIEIGRVRKTKSGWGDEGEELILPAHSGIPTMLKAPYCPPIKDELVRNKVKAALLGVPSNEGSQMWGGANMGPLGVRIASYQYGGYLMDYNIDIFDTYNLVDCGDVPIVPGNVARTVENIEKVTFEVLQAGALPFLIGGDDTIPAGGARALSKNTNGKMGYLKFDCHTDTADSVLGEKLGHAQNVPRALDLPNVDPKNVVIVGVRGALCPKSWFDWIKERGVTLLPMSAIIERGIEDVVNEALERVWDGTESVYLNFDTDSMEACYVPGTTVPEPWGLTTREAIQALRMIGKTKIGCMDIVCFSPLFDPHGRGGITERLVIYLIHTILGTYHVNLK